MSEPNPERAAASPSPPGRPPSRIVTGLLDTAYGAAGLGALAAAALRGRLGPVLDHWRRRGRTAPPEREGTARCVWVHGVSVGEVLAARRLVGALAERRPELDLAVSSSTRLGIEAARAAYRDCLVFSMPLDLGHWARRALDRVRPDLIAIVEHDLWPNLLRFARARATPVALVNARLSDRSLAAYRRLSRLVRWPPRDLAAVCVQDEGSAGAFRSLGFPPGRIAVTGNLKFDVPPPEGCEGVREELGYGADDWVLVAASTHEGEEEAALEAISRVRRMDPRARLILAPRRTERSGEVERLVAARRLSCRRRSASQTGAGAGAGAAASPPDVLLVDTMGELARLEAAGNLVFVGGTLAPVGGHNVIEPASLGRPVVIGPHDENCRSVVREFEARDAIVRVRDAAGLAEAASDLRADPRRARRLGENAARVVGESLGAAERTLERLEGLLDLAGREG